MDSGDLRSLHNYYFLGMYDMVIKEAESVRSRNPEGANIYLYRAQLEVNPKIVANEINNKAPTALRAIKLLGTYRTASEDSKELVFDTLNEWFSYEMVKEDPTLQVIAAGIYFQEQNYKKALKLVGAAGENLEKHALTIQIYLEMDRIDLAMKSAKKMADIDDDDPLTQLATSWVYIAQGGEKVSEAYFLLQELSDKFGKAVNVLNSRAVCQIHLRNYNEALGYLKDARNLSVKDCGKTQPDTLVNTIVCIQHMRKSKELVAKLIEELQDVDPNNRWLKDQVQLTNMFDQYASKYEVKIPS